LGPTYRLKYATAGKRSCNNLIRLYHFSLLARRLEHYTIEGKGNLVPVHAIKEQGTVEAQLYSFFISALDYVGWFLASATLLSAKYPQEAV